LTVVVPTYKFVCTMPKKSGIERDAVMNTWHFIAPSGTPTAQDFLNAMTEYRLFLDDIHNYLGGSLSGTGGGQLCEFFKLTAERPPPGTGLGPPVFSGNIQFTTAPTTAQLPGEVSICISLDGTKITDAEEGTGGTRPASRKRNRKYIGPVGVNTQDSIPTTNESRPLATVRQILVNAVISRLIDGLIAKGWALTGFSPTNWQTFPVLSVWSDNAWDIQRRRGEDPTSKVQEATPQTLPALRAAMGREGLELLEDGFGNLMSQKSTARR
jgi:hypothetical protein